MSGLHSQLCTCLCSPLAGPCRAHGERRPLALDEIMDALRRGREEAEAAAPALFAVPGHFR